MRDLYHFHDNFSENRNVSSRCVIKGQVSEPELSIFIPTFRREDTLFETVKSAINQETNHIYEIIIVSNDPEQGSYISEKLKSLNCSRIYYYINCQNIGLCGNWNRGIELARSDYVSMIHDDDILSPFFVDCMVRAIHDNNSPGIIGVNNHSFSSSFALPAFCRPFSSLKYRSVTKRSFFYGQYICIAGMTVRRSLLFKIGGYSEAYYPNEDTNLIYQALLLDSVINIEFELAGYRKERNLSLSKGTMEKTIILLEETRRCIAKHELFAKRWMNAFDREYLYAYIEGANMYWNLNIDYKAIFAVYGMKLKKPSSFSLQIMGLLRRVLIRV